MIDHVRNNLNLSFVTELPVECLPDDVLSKPLDSLSVRIGKEILGDELDVKALYSIFSRSKSGNKFCSVRNVTAVLADPGWKRFLMDIEVGA